jgi:hypothetical protein
MQIPKSSMVIIAVCGYIGAPEKVKRAYMHMVRSQGRTDRRFRRTGLWRWLVLLLVLAFAASGLSHVAGSGHAAAAATHAHDLASGSQDPAGGDPCCHEDDGQSHGMLCSTTTACSLCVPVVSAGGFPQAGAVRAEIEPTGDRSGRIQPPQFRPPKLPASA